MHISDLFEVTNRHKNTYKQVAWKENIKLDKIISCKNIFSDSTYIPKAMTTPYPSAPLRWASVASPVDNFVESASLVSNYAFPVNK